MRYEPSFDWGEGCIISAYDKGGPTIFGSSSVGLVFGGIGLHTGIRRNQRYRSVLSSGIERMMSTMTSWKPFQYRELMKRRTVLAIATLFPLGAPTPARAREISATLNLSRDEVAMGTPVERVISGDGHTHLVRVAEQALEQLWAHSEAVVRSGPSREQGDGHRHWVRVRIS